MSGAELALDLGFWDRIGEAWIYYRMAIAASAMIGLSLGILGCFVVLRRMALIGDALSHAILPGVVLAFIVVGYLGVTLEGLSFVWSLFLGALLAGLFTAIGISLVSRFARAKEDSAIGIVFTAMFALGVVLISLQPKGTHFDLACFLFGEPLSIKSEDFTSIAIITPLVLGYVIFGYRGLKILSFDPQMAEAIGIRVHVLHYVFMGFLAGTVVAALRTVGVIMSIAMLITPAATAYQLTDRLSTMLILSGLFGAVAAVMGFLMAFVLNIPTGPSMVLFATLIFVLAVVFSPKYGLLEAALRKRSVRRHILEEDVLKALVKQEAPLTERSLAERLEAVGADMTAAIRALRKGGMVAVGANGLTLTDAGRQRGTNLVRSHRLWETYLAEMGNVPPESVHDVAEQLEHAHELAEEISAHLGNPTVDPHGEEIPPASDPTRS